MYSCHCRFHSVSFTYPRSIEPVIHDLSFDLGSGWTSLAGANGCGKTTVLMLASKILQPTAGTIAVSGQAVYCPQRTDEPPAGLAEFSLDWSTEAILLRDMLQVADDWIYRWATLSHGERKRVQIACALSRKPAVLALDEPLNHLDSQGRELIARALESFDGCGLLVSHDRQAMDRLCTSTLLFREDTVTLFRSGYTLAVMEEERERERLVKERRKARENYLRKKRDARRKMLKARTIQAHSTGNSISFRDICRQNLEGASRVDGIVQKAGQRSREAAAKADRALRRMESITYRKRHRTGIEMKGAVSGRNWLLSIPAGELPLGPDVLAFPDLEIAPGDRIALTGRNGSGKSTLLRHLRRRLNCPEERVIWIRQEITACEAAALISRVKALSGETLGFLMTLVRRLGSDPAALLGSALPSPGETRKLMLATGLLRETWLVVMDEPTNHMDLPSIECLQDALGDHAGALLLVSHDRAFLDAVTTTEWRIDGGALSVLA